MACSRVERRPGGFVRARARGLRTLSATSMPVASSRARQTSPARLHPASRAGCSGWTAAVRGLSGRAFESWPHGCRMSGCSTATFTGVARACRSTWRWRTWRGRAGTAAGLFEIQLAQQLPPLAVLLLRRAGEPQRAAFDVHDLRLHFALERLPTAPSAPAHAPSRPNTSSGPRARRPCRRWRRRCAPRSRCGGSCSRRTGTGPERTRSPARRRRRGTCACAPGCGRAFSFSISSKLERRQLPYESRIGSEKLA